MSSFHFYSQYQQWQRRQQQQTAVNAHTHMHTQNTRCELYSTQSFYVYLRKSLSLTCWVADRYIFLSRDCDIVLLYALFCLLREGFFVCSFILWLCRSVSRCSWLLLLFYTGMVDLCTLFFVSLAIIRKIFLFFTWAQSCASFNRAPKKKKWAENSPLISFKEKFVSVWLLCLQRVALCIVYDQFNTKTKNRNVQMQKHLCAAPKNDRHWTQHNTRQYTLTFTVGFTLSAKRTNGTSTIHICRFSLRRADGRLRSNGWNRFCEYRIELKWPQWITPIQHMHLLFRYTYNINTHEMNSIRISCSFRISACKWFCFDVPASELNYLYDLMSSNTKSAIKFVQKRKKKKRLLMVKSGWASTT